MSLNTGILFTALYRQDFLTLNEEKIIISALSRFLTTLVVAKEIRTINTNVGMYNAGNVLTV